jgi:NAD(P)-dependent dehydrogenase (short-subunit alcohol dehydrogenase family)
VPNADLEILLLDLGRLSSVREFTDSYKRRFAHLDILINNAGIMYPPYAKTEDGIESQFAVNYLGHFLLTSLLLKIMPDTSYSRVVSLSSNAQRLGVIKFDDLQSERTYSKTAAYNQSKLACLMFSDELNRRLKANKRKIRSVCAHPGGAETELGRHMSKVTYAFLKSTIVPFITQPIGRAVLPTLLAALGPDVKGGEYFGPQGFFEMKGNPGRAARTKSIENKEDVAQQLWVVSEELTSCSFFG